VTSKFYTKTCKSAPAFGVKNLPDHPNLFSPRKILNTPLHSVSGRGEQQDGVQIAVELEPLEIMKK
jgi:hypothetical protein